VERTNDIVKAWDTYFPISLLVN